MALSSVCVPVRCGLLDHGEIPAHTAGWSNGLVAVMTTGALIATGIHTGPVRVQALGTATQPPFPDEEDQLWQQIIEVTFQALRAPARCSASCPSTPTLASTVWFPLVAGYPGVSRFSQGLHKAALRMLAFRRLQA
ncbi:hypothetical protein [Streptomyces spectabilis]|uniref:Uncharacterized protein n=1 Tax=Streptomyces spectabilis TaxID=68270 RepID=A0A7W8B2L0_STRST|nr:hypothetical protein [Streptomyces spectabilis]MBB5109158.1 hypothetical protein [Streptomyces spectabilis]MCI3907719.1 hypothetical protein [Streptomyces spectabilis]GGV51141.1 hypothetical protein GCM10010245_80490 [Streptomyces spectabilis]